MLLPQQLGLKVFHVDIEATDAVAVNLETAKVLGAVISKPSVVGAVVIESALGANATTGAPLRVLGIAAEIDSSTNVISVTAKFSSNVTRMIRVALLLKE